MRKTKIICTIGPASDSREMIEKLLKAGMNVARINCSHGTHDEHKAKIDIFKATRREMQIPAALMLDTRGPEIRLGNFINTKEILDAGDSFTLFTDGRQGTKEGASITYKELPKEVKPGDTILIDDGKIRLKVNTVSSDSIVCDVMNGGKVSNHKGINVPDVALSMDYLSEGDKNDLLFGIEMDVDYVAASFVRSSDDIMRLRTFLSENGGEQIRIIAKIESNEGIENFEEILKESDGIMIARGDMGVEISYERLPGIQKSIIRRCLQSGKLAITATQMLESMIESPMPTRAEITDVANAVFDGTGAIMLSGETAAGNYPVDAVKVMSKIAEHAECDAHKFQSGSSVWHEMKADDVTNAVGHSACTLAGDIKANAIIAITKTGYTARRMSKFRPSTPIIGITPYEKIYNQLALEWGVAPMKTTHKMDLEPLISDCIKTATISGALKKGDKVVITAGVPMNIPGNTNIIRVETI